MVANIHTQTSVWARKVYNPIGFTKAYNFWLWLIFAGALLGFSLARFMYLNYSKHFCPPRDARGAGEGAAPGECFWYDNFTQYKIGIILHLAGVLPAGVLAVIQFTPFIRHRWIMVHRINGYAALLLYTFGTAGALMIARRAFGGGLDVQVWVGLVAIATLACFVVSYINIKRLQIEQHRAWMLRGWFYAGCIITNRFIMIIGAQLTSNKGYFVVWPCAKIQYTLSDPATLLGAYPACADYINGTNPEQVALVEANFGATAEQTGAVLNLNFGMALWLALIIHAVGVEIYLHLTPREAHRLRQVSYQRQLEAGMRRPGSAGLTADRLGDAEKWVSEDSHKTADARLAVMVAEPKTVVRAK